MSKNIGHSVHDFFDDLPQRVSQKTCTGYSRDVMNAETMSERCTPSNDSLIDGYVVIEVLDPYKDNLKKSVKYPNRGSGEDFNTPGKENTSSAKQGTHTDTKVIDENDESRIKLPQHVSNECGIAPSASDNMDKYLEIIHAKFTENYALTTHSSSPLKGDIEIKSGTDVWCAVEKNPDENVKKISLTTETHRSGHEMRRSRDDDVSNGGESRASEGHGELSASEGHNESRVGEGHGQFSRYNECDETIEDEDRSESSKDNNQEPNSSRKEHDATERSKPICINSLRDKKAMLQTLILDSISLNNRTQVLKNNIMLGNLSLLLSDQITECLDLRLPVPDEIHKRRAREQHQSDTLYPPQLSVDTIDDSSGMFGDGCKPVRITSENTIDEVDTPVTEDHLSQLNRYSTELAFGKISETPRLSSVIKEIEMRPTSGAGTGVSDSSGRKNPQAKLDSEIRNMEHVALCNIGESFDLMKSARPALPPIYTERSVSPTCRVECINKTRDFPTRTKCVKKQTDVNIKTNGTQVKRKPTIPRLLRSSVCYQQGKVDVSIFSDKKFINQSVPVQLNINFVQQPDKPASKTVTASDHLKKYRLRMLEPIKQPLKPVNNNGPGSVHLRINGQRKLEPIPKKIISGVTRGDKEQVKNPIPLTQHQLKTGRKTLKPLAPNKISSKKNDKSKGLKLNGSAFKNRRKPKSEIDNSKPMFWCRHVEEIDLNIIDRRAQKPPFNTHTDLEASYRHRRMFNFME